MATTYTSIYQVFADVKLYYQVNKGGTQTLASFPLIARERWPWFIDNYDKFKKTFVSNAVGNNDTLKILDDLTKYVSGYKTGNTKINPFESEQSLLKFKVFLEQISIDSVGLTPTETSSRNDELRRVASFEEVDFRNMLDFLTQRSAIFAQEIGLGDSTVNKLLKINDRKKRRSAKVSDILEMADINQIAEFIEGLIFDKRQTQKKPPNLLRVAQNNTDPTSGFGVLNIYQTMTPVPFEISFEHMAKKYLGSVQRWYELVTVNNLQSPFIDEVGTKITLITPAAANSVIVSGVVPENVSPGVRINVGSLRYREESRVIERVVFNSDGSVVLYLSGSADLGKFVPADSAFVRVFQPGTVRKNSIIMIPSTTSAGAQGNKPTATNENIQRLSKAFQQFGVDIARDTQTNDWIIDTNGNFKLAYGVPAVQQVIKSTLRTVQGELSFHPSYGINVDIGKQYVGTTSEAAQIGDLLTGSILRDNRIADAQIIRIASTKNSASVHLQVKIKGLDDPIPVSFVT